MAEKKKLTIKDLIEKKDELSAGKKKTQELYVEELDATITIEAPDRKLVMESTELGEDDNYDGNGDEFLVYNIVTDPNLKDGELQKAFGCAEPTDIVEKIFSPGSIGRIAKAGMDLAGYYDNVTPVGDLKN